jgi:5-enolpyruvylshikimate-3-phosphate synthase
LDAGSILIAADLSFSSSFLSASLLLPPQEVVNIKTPKPNNILHENIFFIRKFISSILMQDNKENYINNTETDYSLFHLSMK